MKVFLAAAAVALIVAIGAVYVLDSSLQLQAGQAFISPASVRLPSHGATNNLVGKDWYSAKEN